MIEQRDVPTDLEYQGEEMNSNQREDCDLSSLSPTITIYESRMEFTAV